MTKIEIAQQRIKNVVDRFGQQAIVLGHSGGKDSDTIYHLTASLYPSIRLIHNIKPDTHPATQQRADFVCRRHTAEVYRIPPGIDMVEVKQKYGFKVQIDGTRRDEYNRISKSTDFIVAGKSINRKDMVEFYENGLFGLSILYPIYDWTDAEVFQYLAAHHIPISHEYREL